MRIRTLAAGGAIALVAACGGGSDEAEDTTAPTTEAAAPTTTEAPPETTEAPAPETTEAAPTTTEAAPTTTEAPAEPDEPGPAPEVGDTVSVFDLAPGDCYLADFDEVVIGVFSTCDTTGIDQVTTIIPYDFEEYPGEDEITTLADDICFSAEPDAGIEPVGDSIGWYTPLETEWEDGIRAVTCTSYREADFDEEGLPVQPLVVGESCFAADPTGEGAFGERVDCNEPHEAEYVGSIPSPVEVLPEDFDEAANIVNSACGPLVEELTGRSPSIPGVLVNFNIPGAELGQPVPGDLECYAVGSGSDLLVAPITEVGIPAAYGDAQVIADLEPGTCFVFLGDSFDIGTVSECDEEGALMFIGSFVADPGPYPGQDALRALRSERCLEVLDAGPRLPVLLDSISGTIPDQRAWEAQDMRTVTCDGELPS